VLGLFLLFSNFGIVSLGGGGVDSLGEGVDVGVELVDLSSQDLNLVAQGASGGLVLSNPVLVISSLDLSGLRNLSDQLVAQVDDSLDQAGVSLDGGGGGDLRQDVEDVVPGLSLEGGLGVFSEVSGDLGQHLVGSLLQEGAGLKGRDDDLLRSLDNVLSGVVLGEFLDPFGVSQDLVGIQLGDSLLDQGSELGLLVSGSDLLISNGSLLVELVSQLLDSVGGSLDLVNQSGEVGVTLVLQSEDEVIIGSLLSLQFSLGFLEHSDQILNRALGGELELNSVEQGSSILGSLHSSEFQGEILLLGGGEGGNDQTGNSDES